MAKVTVYKLKDNINYEQMFDMGYGELSDTMKFVLIKQKTFDLEAKNVQAILQSIYTNPNWIEKTYKPNKKDLIEYLGLRYRKDGTIRMTNKFKNIITNWFIEIDIQEDSWIGMTSGDFNDSMIFYNKVILDEYFKDEIEELKQKDLIEEIEVENEE